VREPRSVRTTAFGLMGIVAALATAWFTVSGNSGRSREGLLIRDSGLARQFEPALDEVDIVAASGGVVREALQPMSTLDELIDYAGWLEESSGQRVRLVLYEHGLPRTATSRRAVTEKVVVHFAPGIDIDEIARAAGAVACRTVPYARGLAVLDVRRSADSIGLAAALRADPRIRSADPLLTRWRFKRMVPNDPYFTKQWHLLNTGQNSGTPGIDVNAIGVWNRFLGKGVVVGIVDDGLQMKHPDLSPAVKRAYGWDFVDNDKDPSPNIYRDSHGSACAGVAGARGNNGKGVSGAAPGATLAGLRLISAPTTDETEAAAFAHRNDVIHIKSNSWGPSDNGRVLEGPGPLADAAIADAVTNGRSGMGTIFVWAGGNGRQSLDNANYDGYANSIYTIAVGAVDDWGNHTTYSEPGACLVVCAPSGNSGHQGITTTDLLGDYGMNDSSRVDDMADRDYTQNFGGTSSAAPLAAGVIALMLEANPDLGWRDVQEILIRTAAKVDPTDADWSVNGAGFHFNHNYGAGMVNAADAVNLARTWKNRGPTGIVGAGVGGTNRAIPDNDPNGLALSLNLSKSRLRVEHVTVKVSISHPARGQLAITLTSPSGTVSRLAEPHNDIGADYAEWSFTSVRHWGEKSTGKWTVTVADKLAGKTGTLSTASIEISGTALKN